MKLKEIVGEENLGTRLCTLSYLARQIRYSADLKYCTSISIVDVLKTQS